ncbi:unnamed protein product [Cylicocyclus nassatus]|uniref:Apple domain-containing protein n=1 Tax=Cylicocyclus nassatus TaxID=53992 RepID=A0AA36DTX5_CYLNA|nr:unnamed protein product [Cylicocyclus nassatus]
MNFAVFLLLVTQTTWTSPCVYKRVDVMSGKLIYYSDVIPEAKCFAECLNVKNCGGVCYERMSYETEGHAFCGIVEQICYLYNRSPSKWEAEEGKERCYTLDRNQTEPPQYTRILTFTKKNASWVP